SPVQDSKVSMVGVRDRTTPETSLRNHESRARVSVSRFAAGAAGANAGNYGVGRLLRWPYISSSANSTQMYSSSWVFFSTRRYSGMLIFQGRVNVFGSSIVASYVR